METIINQSEDIVNNINLESEVQSIEAPIKMTKIRSKHFTRQEQQSKPDTITLIRNSTYNMQSYLSQKVKQYNYNKLHLA